MSHISSSKIGIDPTGLQQVPDHQPETQFLKPGTLAQRPAPGFTRATTSKTDMSNRFLSLQDGAEQTPALKQGDIRRSEKGQPTFELRVTEHGIQEGGEIPPERTGDFAMDRTMTRLQASKRKAEVDPSSLKNRIQHRLASQNPRTAWSRIEERAIKAGWSKADIYRAKISYDQTVLEGFKSRTAKSVEILKAQNQRLAGLKNQGLPKGPVDIGNEPMPSMDIFTEEELQEFSTKLGEKLKIDFLSQAAHFTGLGGKNVEKRDRFMGWMRDELLHSQGIETDIANFHKDQVNGKSALPITLEAPFDLPEMPTGFLASLKNWIAGCFQGTRWEAKYADWTYAGQQRTAFQENIPQLESDFRGWMKEEFAKARSSGNKLGFDAHGLKHALTYYSKAEIMTSLKSMMRAADIPYPDLHDQIAERFYNAMVDEVLPETLRDAKVSIAEKKDHAFDLRTDSVERRVSLLRNNAWRSAAVLNCTPKDFADSMGQIRDEIQKLKAFARTPVDYDRDFPGETAELPSDRLQHLDGEIRKLEDELEVVESSFEATREIFGYDGAERGAPTLESLDLNIQEALSTRFDSVEERENHFEGLFSTLDGLRQRLEENKGRLSEFQYKALANRLDRTERALGSAASVCEALDKAEGELRSSNDSSDLLLTALNLQFDTSDHIGNLRSNEPRDTGIDSKLELVVKSQISKMEARIRTVIEAFESLEQLESHSVDLRDDVAGGSGLDTALKTYDRFAEGVLSTSVEAGNQAVPGKFAMAGGRISAARNAIVCSYLGVPENGGDRKDAIFAGLTTLHEKGVLTEEFLSGLASQLRDMPEENRAGHLATTLAALTGGDLSEIHRTASAIVENPDSALALKLAMLPSERKDDVIRLHYGEMAATTLERVRTNPKMQKALAVIGENPATTAEFLAALPKLAKTFESYFSSSEGLGQVLENCGKLAKLIDPEQRGELSPDEVRELAGLASTLQSTLPTEEHIALGQAAVDQLASGTSLAGIFGKLGFEDREPTREELVEVGKKAITGDPSGGLGDLDSRLDSAQLKLRSAQDGAKRLEMELTGPLRELSPILGEELSVDKALERLKDPKFAEKANTLTNLARIFLADEQSSDPTSPDSLFEAQMEALKDLSQELENFNPSSLKDDSIPLFTALRRRIFGFKPPEEVVQRLREKGGERVAEKFIGAWKHLVTLDALARSQEQIQEHVKGLLRERDELIGDQNRARVEGLAQAAVLQEFQATGKSFDSFRIEDHREAILGRLEQMLGGNKQQALLALGDLEESIGRAGGFSGELVKIWGEGGGERAQKLQTRLANYQKSLEEFSSLIAGLEEATPLSSSELEGLRSGGLDPSLHRVLEPLPDDKFGSQFPSLSDPTSTWAKHHSLSDNHLEVSADLPLAMAMVYVRTALKGTSEGELKDKLLEASNLVNSIWAKMKDLRRLKDAAPMLRIGTGQLETDLKRLETLVGELEGSSSLKPGSVRESIRSRMVNDLPGFVESMRGHAELLKS